MLAAILALLDHNLHFQGGFHGITHQTPDESTQMIGETSATTV